MKTRASISRRLMVTLAAALSLLWVAATVLAVAVIQHGINTSYDSGLAETAQRLLPLAVHEVNENKDFARPEEMPRISIRKHAEYMTYQLRDVTGRILIRSHDAGSTPFQAPLTAGFVTTGNLRIYTEPAVGRGLYMQVAEPLSHRRETLLKTALSLFLPLLVLLPLGLLAVLWLVRRGLRPLLTLGKTIGNRDDRNLQPLESRDLPAEILPMVESINYLLGRIGVALEAEKAFAANSAHELRTPVAGALAQAQRLLAELEEGPVRQRVAQIEIALKRLRDLSAKLLQLSRAEQSGIVTEKAVDLVPALRSVMEELERYGVYAGRIRLDKSNPATLHWHMDPDAFAIALRNIVENALLHGDPAEPVRIALEADGSVHVVNAGTVVPAATLAELTGRFVRGAESVTGSGIGLAIAETIMQRGGGSLLLKSPATGRQDGFEAVLSCR